jgi:hypothetical protein
MAARAAQAPAPKIISEDDGDVGSSITLDPGLVGGTRAADPEFTIIETDDDFTPLNQPAAAPAPRPETVVETRPSEEDQGQTDGDQDTRLADEGETEVQRQAREKRPRRQRQHEARDRVYAENRELRTRLEQLEASFQTVEPRLSEYDQHRVQDQIAGMDRQVNDYATQAADARRRLAVAMTAGDVDAMNKALDDRDNAVIQGSRAQAQLTYLKSQAERGTTAKPAAAAPVQPRTDADVRTAAAPISRVVQGNIDDFIDRNPWVDLRKGTKDPDSQVLLAVDNMVASDGFDPRTQEYWDELEDRCRQYLPHRFGNAQPAPRTRQAPAPQAAVQPQRRGPPVAAPADRGPALPSNQVYLTPGRKTAMIDAGVLDRDGKTVINREKFNNYMKKYGEYDRDNGVARQ